MAVAAADVIAVHKPLGHWRGLGLVSFPAPVQQRGNLCNRPKQTVTYFDRPNAVALAGLAVILADCLWCFPYRLAILTGCRMVGAGGYCIFSLG